VGTVTDTSGAILVGSKVIVVDTTTSFTSEVVTNDEGAYSIPYLAPATYRVTVESGGFKRYVREGVLVRTGEIPRANLAATSSKDRAAVDAVFHCQMVGIRAYWQHARRVLRHRHREFEPADQRTLRVLSASWTLRPLD